MLFIPYNTDAPIAYRPYGTVGLIVANIITFILTSAGHERAGWVLRFGDGLHPVEWISSAFLHFGPVHLIGNMIFLWSYGLIIEGKLGPLKFLGLYLTLAAIDGLLCQSLMLGDLGGRGAGGASGVIFALMAIALIWAPYNCFEVLFYTRSFLYGWHCSMFEMPVWGLSCIYLGLNLLGATLRGFEMSTPVLHLLGAVVGFPVGLLFVTRNWVDCEGWDLITRWKEDSANPNPIRLGASQKIDRDRTDAAAAPKRLSAREQAEKFRELAGRQQFEAAARAAATLRSDGGHLSHSDLPLVRRCVNGLKAQQQWAELVTLLRETYLPLQPSDSERAKLMLAEIQTVRLNQPRAALRTLAEVNTEKLDQADTRMLKRLKAHANQAIEAGVMELQR